MIFHVIVLLMINMFKCGLRSTLPIQRSSEKDSPTLPPTTASKNEFNMKYGNCSMMMLASDTEL